MASTAKDRQTAGQEEENVNAVGDIDNWNAGGETQLAERETALVVTFENVGDTFVGYYRGKEHIVPESPDEEPFDRHSFETSDGEVYAINDSWQLQRAMTKVPEGALTRVELRRLVKTGRGLNPMKSYRVEYKL